MNYVWMYDELFIGIYSNFAEPFPTYNKHAADDWNLMEKNENMIP